MICQLLIIVGCIWLFGAIFIGSILGLPGRTMELKLFWKLVFLPGYLIDKLDVLIESCEKKQCCSFLYKEKK